MPVKRYVGGNWSDRTFVIQSVQDNGQSLYYASGALKNDKHIVSIAVQQNGTAIRYASPELQSDKEVVLLAVAQNGLILYMVSPELRADKDVVSTAVQQNGFALQYASPELQADKDVVLLAVQQNGFAIQYASIELRADRDVILQAVLNEPKSLQYADRRFQSDPELLALSIYNADQSDMDALSHRDKQILIQLVELYFQSIPLTLPTIPKNGEISDYTEEESYVGSDNVLALTGNTNTNPDNGALIVDGYITRLTPDIIYTLKDKLESEHLKIDETTHRRLKRKKISRKGGRPYKKYTKRYRKKKRY
jgi:hypothetical protein